MTIDKDHLKKDTFIGGWLVPWVATLNGEWVGGGASGYDHKNPENETLSKAAKHAADHMELNKIEYDKLMIGAECKIWRFDRDYSQLDDKDRWMLNVCIPDITKEIKLYNECQRLVRVAGVRIKKAGFRESCSRCGGSGHYSRNARGDSLCYKCNGVKYTIPKLTKKKMSEIETKFQEIFTIGTWEEFQQNDYEMIKA